MLFGIAIFYARPAHQGTKQVTQPDGSVVTIRLVGDEYLHYNVTADGYSLVRRDDGAYVYARLNVEGQLEPTSMLAHDAGERSASERGYLQAVGHLVPLPTVQAEQMRRQNRAQRVRTLSQRRASRYDYSKFRGLVVLVEYNDCPFRYDDYADIMDGMINDDNYTGNSRTNIPAYGIRCTGSVRDYYRDNSSGVFVPSFDVVGPVKVNRSQYYASKTLNATQLMIDACTAADPEVNFADYDVDSDGKVDMIYFIFSGLGSYIEGNDSRLLWPHQYDISYSRTVRKDGVKLGRYACSTELFGSTDWSVLEGIGTICHEFSHVLGLPDFYDTANLYEYEECVTPSSWSVMANGADYNYGRTPCCFSLFERYALGFAQPTLIEEPGSFSLEGLQASNTGYRLNTPVSREFFFLENRQRTKWDSALPGHGMLIFRVDSTSTSPWEYNTVNDNPDHPYYELLRAGGVKSDAYSISAGTASDPFPGTRSVRTINNETSPSLKTWSGMLNNLALRNIRENDGVITFDAYAVNALTGVSFGSDEYKLSVGTKQQLVVLRDPESAPCELSFASDNKSVATVDADGCVTALSEGVAHITVTANKTLKATCTVTVTSLREVPDIASFCAMMEGDEALLTLTDAQVLYVYAGNVYLRDATGSIVVSGSGLDVKRNDVLNGSILGRLTLSNSMPQFTPATGTSASESLTVSQGESAQPTEVFADELTAARYADLVLVRGLTLVRDGGIFAVVGDRRVRLWNKFQIKSPKITLPSNIVGKFYDVLAVYGTDVVNGEVIDELYVLTSPTEGQDPDAVSAPLADGPASPFHYNLGGQQVCRDFRGIVVRDGRKFLQR